MQLLEENSNEIVLLSLNAYAEFMGFQFVSHLRTVRFLCGSCFDVLFCAIFVCITVPFYIGIYND